jgi:hypothetical protein
MKKISNIKILLFLIIQLIFYNVSIFAELPEELRKEVIAFIRPGYIEFPELESSSLALSSITINSQELSDAFTQHGVLTIQRGFPEFTDDDTIRTSETGYTFVIPQFSRIFRLQLNSEENTENLVNILTGMTEVIGYAEKNSDAELAQVVPNDELFFRQWFLNNTHFQTNADIHATTAWLIYKGNPDVKVGIFDCGVYLGHPDLYMPYPPGHVSGDNYEENADQCYSYHGTHIAGLIGAHANNSIGIAGVDWNCKLVSKKILNGYNQFLVILMLLIK